MGPIEFAIVALVNFVNIQGRAFQQLNVQHDRFLWVPVASHQMGACEVFLWGGAGAIAVQGTLLDQVLYAVALGSSGTVGAWTSMYVHRRLRNRAKG